MLTLSITNVAFLTVYLNCVNDLINGVIIQRAMLTEAYVVEQHYGPVHALTTSKTDLIFWFSKFNMFSNLHSTIGRLMFSGND